MQRSLFQNCRKRTASFVRWVGFLLALATLGGCGPELSKEDLGTVEFKVPEVAGSKEPYPMPELGPPLDPKSLPPDRPF